MTHTGGLMDLKSKTRWLRRHLSKRIPPTSHLASPPRKNLPSFRTSFTPSSPSRKIMSSAFVIQWNCKFWTKPIWFTYGKFLADGSADFWRWFRIRAQNPCFTEKNEKIGLRPKIFKSVDNWQNLCHLKTTLKRRMENGFRGKFSGRFRIRRQKWHLFDRTRWQRWKSAEFEVCFSENALFPKFFAVGWADFWNFHADSVSGIRNDVCVTEHDGNGEKVPNLKYVLVKMLFVHREVQRVKKHSKPRA